MQRRVWRSAAAVGYASPAVWCRSRDLRITQVYSFTCGTYSGPIRVDVLIIARAQAHAIAHALYGPAVYMVTHVSNNTWSIQHYIERSIWSTWIDVFTI